ncbi:MAG: hypothetical protein JWP89_4380 [Schlesneria sp.]|nr:hypothetical protein [Schlesneria sp.]
MQSLFDTMEMMLTCGTILAVSFIVLLSIPQCKLREFLLPIVGWCVAIFCGIYCISPVDLLPEVVLGPFGYFEDIGAAVTGIAAARMAMNPSKN